MRCAADQWFDRFAPAILSAFIRCVDDHIGLVLSRARGDALGAAHFVSRFFEVRRSGELRVEAAAPAGSAESIARLLLSSAPTHPWGDAVALQESSSTETSPHLAAFSGEVRRSKKEARSPHLSCQSTRLGDEARAALASEIRPRPLALHPQPVSAAAAGKGCG
jgi:hypothetical protein